MPCRHHDVDEVCADCTPEPVEGYDKPGPPVSKERGLARVREARQILDGTTP